MLLTHVGCSNCLRVLTDWRVDSNANKNPTYAKLVRWFADFPGLPHVYSIHHMVQCGMKYDKLPGEWYGPSTAALVLRDIAEVHYRLYEGELRVYVTGSDTLYTSEVHKLCTGGGAGAGVGSGGGAGAAGEEGVDAPGSDGEGKVEGDGPGSGSGCNMRELLTSVHGILTHNPHPPVSLEPPPAPPQAQSQSPAAPDFFDPLLRPPPGASSVERPWSAACLVIVPLKLGVDAVNPLYIQVGPVTYSDS